MDIRPFRSGDMSAVSDIYRRARSLEFAGEMADLSFNALEDDPDMLSMFRQSTILVFDDQDVIKGFVGYVYDYIAWLYVCPEYQRQKIAHQLLSHVLHLLRGMPLRLSLVASNQVAKACYEKYGFREMESFGFEFQDIIWQALEWCGRRDNGAPCQVRR